MECNSTLKRKRRRPGRNVKGEDVTSFFRIFLQPTHYQKKMRLPHRFVDTNGGKLVSRVVSLVDPENKRWEVRLSRDGEGDVWFDGDRWVELVNFYSIQHGHFMVFEYNHPESRFDFKIFDPSTCEIDYKSSCVGNNIKLSASKQQSETHVNTVRVEHIDVDDEDDEDEDDDDDDDNDDPIKFLHKDMGKLMIPITPTGDRSDVESFVSRQFWSKGGYSIEEQRRVVHALKTIKPFGPNFLAIIRKASCMPAEFSKAHFSCQMCDLNVTIVDDQGRNWSIPLTPRPGTEGVSMHISSLIRDAYLRIGDILILELIKAADEESVFKVFRLPAPPVNPSGSAGN